MNGRDVALISFGAFLAISAIYTFGAAPLSTSCQPSLCAAVTLAPVAASPSPRNIYFDIGANNGESITSFLAARPGLEWDVVLVEATPRFTEQLEGLCTEVSATGAARSCLPLVETALTTFDGFVDIFVEETRLEHDASSIVAGAHVRDGPGSYFNASAVDVVTLFREVFPVYEEDNVVVKIDIEGAEFPVIVRALLHGLVPLWDELSVEWHSRNPFIFANEREQAIHSWRETCLSYAMQAEGLKVGAWGRELRGCQGCQAWRKLAGENISALKSR